MPANSSASAKSGTTGKTGLGLRKVYVKDLSFELPDAPRIFTDAVVNQARSAPPTMRTSLTRSSQKMEDGEYEISIRLTVHATDAGNKSFFLVEVEQAGIFRLANDRLAERKALLEVRGPEALLPFAREVIWSTLNRGGVPPLLIEDIDFQALLAQD